jgi:hypothetical protein
VKTSYTQIPKKQKAALDTFFADVGSTSWEVLWDTSTGVPLRIFGKGVPAPGASASPEAAVNHARAMLARHIGLLAPGASPEHFTLTANELRNGLRTVAFKQLAPGPTKTSAGVPVVNGQLSFRFKNDRLFVIASEAIPFASARVPKVTTQAAEAAASEWMIQSFGSAFITKPAEIVVLPLIRPRAVSKVTAFRVGIKAGALELPYDVYIDAESGARVARETLASFLTATALYDVPVRYPQEPGPPALYAPRLAEIDIDGAATTTDLLGAFSWPGPADAAVTLSVHSAETVITNHSGTDATGLFTAADGAQITWSLADDEQGDAQLTTFIHLGIVKERARLIAPEMAFLKQKLFANVNRDDPDYKCNAFWDGNSVNFFIQYSPCNNTGRLADVIYHEFGHGFHQNAIISGAGMHEPALAEGQSDYLACTTTGDPDMGPGFFINGGVLRHCENDRRWPGDIDFDPHETGLIFAGAMWDLRESFIGTYGDKEGIAAADALYYAAIQTSTNVPTTYAEVVASDDDDGDLSNGTPNICAINEAFGAHGLSPYVTKSGHRIAHQALSIVPSGQAPYEVRVSQEVLFPKCGAGKLDSVRVQWGIGDINNKVDLAPDGDDFVGAIPPQLDGTAIRYRIVATADGNDVTLPDNPADDQYRVFVGDVTPIYCNDFEAQADGWEFSDDNGGNGDFKWAEPEGLAVDPSKAYSGSLVIGNDLTVNGLYASDKEVYADSPTIDLAGNTKVRLQFRRWLAVEDGYFDQATIYANGKKLWENEGTDEQFGVLHHIDKEWRFEDIDLSSIPSTGGTSVKVRFQLTSDPYFESGGWNIDDFCIVAWTPPPVDATTTSSATGGNASGGNGGDDSGEVASGCSCGVAPESPYAWGGLAVFSLGMAARRLRARRKR